MVIDDNISIHQDFIKILKTQASNKLDKLDYELFGAESTTIALPNFEIDVASQGQEGVKLIEAALSKGLHYALAFVDIRMPPGWDGIETIKHIWALDKDIQIVICTAYSDYSWEETVAHLGKTDNLLILKKPFDNIAVRQLACALTAKWQLTEKNRHHTSELQQQVADRTKSLQKSLSLVKSTFESTTDGILVVNNQGIIIDYNQKMIDLIQIPQSILNTKSLQHFLEYLKTKIENPENDIEKISQSNTTSNEVTCINIKFKNGRTFECYSQPHKLNDQIIGRILDFRDITQRAQLEDELKFQAMHDSLTGLANRIKLLENLKIAINIAAQNHTNFAVVFIDFDRFKLINDSLSHIVGDELLRQAAVRFKTIIRSEDTLARLGGDEFVIIFLNMNEEKYIQDKINQLMELSRTPFKIDDREVTLTTSVGISLYPKDGINVDMLLRHADAAMYQAKNQKGNCYQFYTSEMSIQSLAELDQETELRQAIAKNEFFLSFQPEFDVVNENLIAVEALLRWQHPTRGILLPIDFVPFAEEIGLMVTIGEWVLKTACTQNKAWQDKGLPPIRIAVNVSVQQFNTNFVDTVKKILDKTKLEPKYLELELTENVILSNREILKAVTELKKIGVKIAIDDIGTGYSSLSYLRKLPLDRLKIDGSIIQNIETSTDDEVIIRAVIALAKKLNLEVLAEGVKTKHQFNFIKENLCSDIQGFYFSKPTSAKEIENYLLNPLKISKISNGMNNKEK